jgi:S-(hydroxymethyl)glutathione dehydrogenase/alcohol dehydrogenase
MKSLAAIAWNVGAPWSIEEIDIDPPGPGEVLVEWAAAGLCHSDEGIRSGDRVLPELESSLFPLLGGHEGAGVVSDVGPGVTAFAIGDHVLANFAPACGECRYCASGRGFICNGNKGFLTKGQLADGTVKHRARGQDLCVMGKLGTFAERTVVSVDSLQHIDHDLALESACLVSCGVTTGWGSAVERGGTKPGDVVVVVGVGGLGTSAVQGARIAGAQHIIAVDPIAFRREMSQKVGATSTAASMADARVEIMHLTNGQGADVVILTPSVVTGAIIHEALDITGKGAVCVVTGMGPKGVSDVPIDIGNFTLFNKELRGCLFGSLDPRSSAPRLLSLYRQGLLDLDIMVTTYPLRNIAEGLADSNEGRNVRGVLTMNTAS